MHLISVKSKPRSHIIYVLFSTLKNYIFAYHTYFLNAYTDSNFLCDVVNNSFGSPNVCHQIKKCSNGRAHTLIGIW